MPHEDDSDMVGETTLLEICALCPLRRDTRAESTYGLWSVMSAIRCSLQWLWAVAVGEEMKTGRLLLIKYQIIRIVPYNLFGVTFHEV